MSPRKKFRRSKDTIRAHFDEYERGLLSSLLTQTVETLAPPTLPADPLEALFEEQQTSLLDRDDPAVARLFPTVYADPAAEHEYRRLNEVSERVQRAHDLQVMLSALARAEGDEPTEIPAGELDSWLKGLNSIRLVLASRLGVETAEDAETLATLPPDHPLGEFVAVYEWLGAVQWLLLDQW